MDVHASPAELPELQEFLARFQVRFRRPAGQEALERYTTGLLTERPNQNCDTMAQAIPGTSEQRLQECLTNRPWDEEDLNRQRVQKLSAEATLGDGVLVLDDTGFPKQGKASVGVERQDSGTLGKVGHGQMAVTCCYTDPPATWPVAVRLSLPKTWAYDPARRRRSRSTPNPKSRWRSWSRRGRGGCRIAAWWPRLIRGTPRTFLRAWRRGRRRMWSGCGQTTRSAWGVRRAVRCGGRTSSSRPCLVGRGARCAGGMGAKEGGARRLWPRGVGASPVTGSGRGAGCWASGLLRESRRSGSTPGATCPPRPAWRSRRGMPTDAMRLSRCMKRPRGSWAGTTTRGGCGPASIGMP
jgi:DDE superfamily endonuclease